MGRNCGICHLKRPPGVPKKALLNRGSLWRIPDSLHIAKTSHKLFEAVSLLPASFLAISSLQSPLFGTGKLRSQAQRIKPVSLLPASFLAISSLQSPLFGTGKLRSQAQRHGKLFQSGNEFGKPFSILSQTRGTFKMNGRCPFCFPFNPCAQLG